jgi:hypothetical protein
MKTRPQEIIKEEILEDEDIKTKVAALNELALNEE